MNDQEIQKIAEDASNTIDLMVSKYCGIGYSNDDYNKHEVKAEVLKSLRKVRDAQEEKLEYIKEELEVALGKCHGSLEYPVGTILKQLISKIGGGE